MTDGADSANYPRGKLDDIMSDAAVIATTALFSQSDEAER